MSKKSKWSEYSSIEKVQEFINSNNISSKIDFKNKYQSLYTRARLNNWLDNLKFKIIKRNDLSKFDNIDSIRVFINNNNIKSRTEFKKKYNGLYWKSVRSGWIHDIKFEKDMKDWSYYDSIVKVQNFIYSNNILNHDQFSKEYPGLLSKCDRNRWSIYLNYINGKINNWNNINSIIDAQNFININNINNRELFTKNFSGLSDKCYRNNWMKDLIFKEDGIKSCWEINLKIFLEKNNYTIESEIVSYSNYSKIDIFIPDLNIAIEIQGPYHFPVMGKLEQYLFQRKSDIKKNRWCREQGITLLYFSYDKLLVEKYGYPWYIYTSGKELLAEIERIKSL